MTLDALARRQQAERQDDELAGEAEFGLRLIRLDEGEVGNAVRYDLDLFRRNPIHGVQQLTALLGHHDDLRRRIDDPIHDRVLGRCRLGEDRVKRRDDRHGQARQQRRTWPPASPPKMPNSCWRETASNWPALRTCGSAHVVSYFFVVDFNADDGRILVGATVVSHRHDACLHIRA